MKLSEVTLDLLNEQIGGKYPITDRQFLFVMEYTQHQIGMLAVRNAGYNHSTPGSQSSAANKLLRNSRIRQAIEIVTSIMEEGENGGNRNLQGG